MFKKMEATVHGRVQGVGFRFFVERMANLLHVTGWARNTYEGTVKVEAIGTEDNIKEFLLTLEQGPPMARVDEVKYNLEDCPYNEYEEFSIK